MSAFVGNCFILISCTPCSKNQMSAVACKTDVRIQQYGSQCLEDSLSMLMILLKFYFLLWKQFFCY